MLYLNERVDIPDKSTFAQVIGNYTYIYLNIENYYNENHEQRHKKRVIGRLVKDEDGVERMIPNDNYYRYYDAQKPASGPVKKSGPERRKPRPIEEKGENEHAGLGYALAVKGIMIELRMYGILVDLLGKTMADRAVAIIAFYVQCGGHPALTDFPYFMDEQMTHLVEPFDARRVCEDFDRADQATMDAFVRRWLSAALQDPKKGEHLLYDVTSISTTSETIPGAEYGYNRDHEDLEQINIGLVCTGQSKRPLFVSKYDGSINDTSNFNYVLQRCEDLGLPTDFDIIYDGGFDAGNIDYSALKGHGVLTARSFKKYKGVRDAILANIGKLQQDNPDNIIDLDSSPIYALRIPFSMGNTQGSLIITLDHAKKSHQLKTLMKNRKKLRAELEKAQGFPTNPQKFDGYFKLTKKKGRKGFTFEDDVEGFRQMMALCGTTAFYSTRKSRDTKQDIVDYRAKDTVEKMFDRLKNDLMDGRIYVHNEGTLNGKMFYLFLSLIVFKEMESRFAQFRKETKLTMANCFTELKRIKMVKGNGAWHPNQALNSRQKALFKAIFTLPDWAEMFDVIPGK